MEEKKTFNSNVKRKPGISHLDKRLAEKLRFLRISRDCGQEELGDALGVSYQQVQKYEKSKNRISAVNLAQILVFFEVDASYFFSERFLEEIKEDMKKRIVK